MSPNALASVHLSTAQGESADICLHGAHIISWKNSRGEEQLFLSKKAIFESPKAIRGGVPICFPQFGGMGPLGSHGFTRNSTFEVQKMTPSQVAMVFQYDGKSVDKYAHPFEVCTTVTLGDNRLTQDFKVTNTGSSPMTFTAALHTYLRVSSIHGVSVVGLKDLTYLDNTKSRHPEVESSTEVVFKGEVDRVYVNAPDKIVVKDGNASREIVIQKKGFSEVVVWNPWVEKTKALADMDDEEYENMVCIEPAIAGDTPVCLGPGESWLGQQSIEA